MIQLIIGDKGKGKTKVILDRVNDAVKTANGNIVYLDKNTKNMFELNNRIRLINVSDFCITDCDEFLGFVAGIISQDHDLEQMYLDCFLINAHLEGKDVTPALDKLDMLSKKFDVDFIISAALCKSDVPEKYQDCISVVL